MLGTGVTRRPRHDETVTPAERLLDLVVFGPAGLALTAAEEFPKLGDKGSDTISRARCARPAWSVRWRSRWVGALDQSLGHLADAVPDPGGEVADGCDQPPIHAPAPTPAATTPATSRAGHRRARPSPSAVRRAAAALADGSAGAHGVRQPAPRSANGRRSGLASRPLAIPGLRQPVGLAGGPAPGGLSPCELIEVRAHEQSHRHRRTILNRVEQLLAGVDAT